MGGGLLSPLVELTNSAPFWHLLFSPSLILSRWGRDNSTPEHSIQDQYRHYRSTIVLPTSTIYYVQLYEIASDFTWQIQKYHSIEIGQEYLTNTSAQCSSNRTGCVVVVSWSLLGDPADWSQIPARNIRQGVRQFERFEFLSEKINFAALGGSKSSSFEPDTSHP